MQRGAISPCQKNKPALINRDLFVDALKKIKGKWGDVFCYMADNSFITDGHVYTFVGTIEELHKETGMARQTIRRIIKSMEETRLLISVKKNMWIFNPHIMFYDEDSDKYSGDEE